MVRFIRQIGIRRRSNFIPFRMSDFIVPFETFYFADASYFALRLRATRTARQAAGSRSEPGPGGSEPLGPTTSESQTMKERGICSVPLSPNVVVYLYAFAENLPTT